MERQSFNGAAGKRVMERPKLCVRLVMFLGL